MSKAQQMINNVYTELMAKLGVASIDLSNAQKKVDDLKAQAIALNVLAPSLKSIGETSSVQQTEKTNNP